MKLRKLARQLAAAAVAGAMALSLCMPALAETWNISNGSHGFSKVDSVCVTGTTSGRTVELFGVDASNDGSSSEYTETDETVLSGSGAIYTSLNGHSAPVSVALNELDIMLEDISGSGACIRTYGDASVDLRGTNILTIPGNYGICSDDGSLTLGGTGTLNIRSGIGIRVGGSFTLNSGIVDIAETETSTKALQSGVTADTITLNGGRIHVSIAPPTSEDYHNDALSARKGIFIHGGSVVTKTASTVSGADTVQHRALYSRDGDIVISGGSVQAEGGELYAESGSIRISGGEVKAHTLCGTKGLNISGGKVTTKGFNVSGPIVLSGDAKVTFDGYLDEGPLSRFDLSGLTTDGYLRYQPDPLDTDAEKDSEGYVVIHGTLEPQPGGDAGNASGDAGGAIAAVVLGSAAVWGGYEVVTRVILNELLPEGAAIPANRGQLALLVWNNAGRPEPAAQPAFADVADADMAKAAQWCVEQGIMEAKSADTFKPEGWTPKFNVIETWNKAFPKAK
ncbi:hypothetical protein DXA66_03680 [Faecalibacterium sp. OF03-6AC]|uniref:S-layer homology domain-containing protein n=1 Tax=Faecalibacterium TaxID=216851 RepID=UPI000E4BB54B|nr:MULTISPECIES: S-layer homology domain-containing protein [Faecalibacterium]RHP64509.1 hypothetical protein DXA66_03680 [Faecalibacterium sp. OF03-6AC]RJW78452.1 hypothetical protein DWV57_06995 [Faecalibacterium sp. AF10-46]